MVLWVESWVAASKALTQWDVLVEYARGIDNVPLAMDCMWRLHEWEALQGSLLQNKHQVGSLAHEEEPMPMAGGAQLTGTPACVRCMLLEAHRMHLGCSPQLPFILLVEGSPPSQCGGCCCCCMLALQMEPAVSSCLLAAYASLRDADAATANAHIEKGFQYSLARWWQVMCKATAWKWRCVCAWA